LETGTPIGSTNAIALFCSPYRDNMTVNSHFVPAVPSMKQLLKLSVETLLQSLRNSPPVIAQYTIIRPRGRTKVSSAVK
jgi:hypothetical protein